MRDLDSGADLIDEDGSNTESVRLYYGVNPGSVAQVKVDGAPYYRDDEPYAQLDLSVGTHTVQVRGKYQGYYDLSPASVTFTIKPKAPAPPLDTDGDGVVDSADACPTVYGLGADGCPVSPGGVLTEGCTGATTTLVANTVYDRKKFTKCAIVVKGANITVQNSQIVGLGGTNAVENPDVQIYVNGAQNFKLINSEVKDNAWEAGLYADGNATLTIQNSDFHDNGARTNNGTTEDLSNRAHNVYLSDVASALVENSRFTGARAFGLQVYPGTNDKVTLRHNWIAQNGKSGIIVGGDNTGAANITNSAFTDNAITENGANGIQAYRLGTGTGNVFAPNYIWNNGGAATSGISGTQTNSAPPGAWLVPPLVRYP